MPSPSPILLPLLNPNEPEALLAAVHVTEGQRVAKGDLLFTVETTKSAADVLAEDDGYLVGLRLSPGQSARAGEIMAYLAESPDWQPPALQVVEPQPGGAIPSRLRITKPAMELVRQHHLDLSQFPVGPLITETTVRALLEKPAESGLAAPAGPFDPQAVLVYGGGGHGKAVIDLLRALNVYRIAGVVDDGIPAGEVVLGAPVLGGAEALAGQFARGVRLAVNAVGGIGNLGVRIQVFQRLAEAGFACPAAVHPRAFVEATAVLSAGVQTFPLAYVGSEVRVGFGAIVNTGAILSHDCTLGDYVNISPGAILAGGVAVGAETLIGMGVTVNLNVKIGPGARIGNGATVKADVPSGGVVRAGTIWPE
jgi:sugar O-acyltransferase (sialic acid O-acetyltransferase NeuD family)